MNDLSLFKVNLCDVQMSFSFREFVSPFSSSMPGQEAGSGNLLIKRADTIASPKKENGRMEDIENDR